MKYFFYDGENPVVIVVTIKQFAKSQFYFWTSVATKAVVKSNSDLKRI